MSVIAEFVAQHTEIRHQAINLIVSENRLSQAASEVLASDLASRYAAPFYAGTETSNALIHHVTEQAKSLFNAKHINLSPISGSNSLMATVFALTEPGDKVGRVPPFFPGGGYPFQYEVFHRQSLPLPFSDEDWQLDVPATLALIDAEQPKLVVLGASIYTHPMPVKEVAEVVHSYGGILAYDSSHSLGLTAGGQYQDPLGEGADLIFGSTHKTFPGPQGGIIITNDDALYQRVELVSNFTPLNGPTMICNPHLARIACMGIVIDEVPWQRYAKQIVDNARAFANALADHGFVMRGGNNPRYEHFTDCHQVLPRLNQTQGLKYRNKLAQHGIHVDGFMRIGTAEITRLGYSAEECTQLGHLMAEIVQSSDKLLPQAKDEINAMNAAHTHIVM